ncbi:HNH endonuclease [Burkholderia dolosa]|nr:HNH endonuclease [Burkholderia dolosa]AJY13486.1 AP2 domain protein [Burkholderia dolosa AU0158]AKE06693.1 hypothetical protein XM57_08885 [Burkholderia cepacia]ETP64868.1 hypothetical protein BDSB_05545 [Burkholderia dolosa PC543]MCC5029742.1 HNH endonuclease [Burkholderia dolosa]UEC16957.1 HNH endonuclease [Burkholderia dolosa]
MGEALAAQRLRELLNYDPETGVLTWRVGRQGNAGAGSVAGDVNARGYRRVSVDRRRVMAHVLIWVIVTGEWPDRDIDHVNGVRSDNRWSNLRLATRSENNQNQRNARRDNVAGLLGVSPNRDRWAASITVDGQKQHIGTYDTPELAHAAYLDAKRRVHIACTI